MQCIILHRNVNKNTTIIAVNYGKKSGEVKMLTNIIKRDGRIMSYDESKIVDAIFKAMDASAHGNREDAVKIAHLVAEYLEEKNGNNTPKVEDIQDAVELTLMRNGFEDVAKNYNPFDENLRRIDKCRCRKK